MGGDPWATIFVSSSNKLTCDLSNSQPIIILAYHVQIGWGFIPRDKNSVVHDSTRQILANFGCTGWRPHSKSKSPKIS